MIWPVALLGVLFLLLPWLPVGTRIHHAGWFQREQQTLSVITVALVTAIAALTIIALYFRGTDWALAF
jgi:hypothetical protein